MGYKRYAVYYTPPASPFARRGATWLGWDVSGGVHTAQPEVIDLDMAAITRRPRQYGFHATLKAPFRLAPDQTAEGLALAVARIASRTEPAACDGLDLAALGSFLAFRPRGDPEGLNRIAATMVTEIDAFRATPTAGELSRRRKPGLTARQEDSLQRWGYPYVMEDFRFHMTVTGRLTTGHRTVALQAASDHFATAVPRPFELSSVTLVGEDSDGYFHEIERFVLAG